MHSKNLGKTTISVVIPAYNDAKLLKKCLQALKKQDFSLPYELIVVNGPSHDNTKEIALRYADVVIDQSKIGIGQARNEGCAEAQSKIIAITDADVIVPKYWLSRIYQYFKKYKYVIALTGPYRFINSEKLNNSAKVARIFAKEFHRILTDSSPLSGTNMAVRRDAYMAVGGFDPEITGLEDVELGMRLSKIGKIIYVEDLLVKTTDRRFRHPVQHVLTKLIPTYFKRTVLRTKDSKVIWKPTKD